MNTTEHTSTSSEHQSGTTSLTRSREGRMLAGVASGIAAYLGVDVLIVRIAFVVLTFLGALGIPLYLACWLLIPDESTGDSYADGIYQAWRN
jgi:phage shock protein PspC (stress-responsive transcriptional regulator)